MRRARVIGIAAAALVVATGCSNQAQPATGAEAAQVVRASYSETVAAQTARIAIDMQVVGGAGQPLALTGSGAADFASDVASLTLTLPGGAGSSEVRFVNGFVYGQVPPRFMAMVPGGKPWVSVDVDKLLRRELDTGLGQLSDTLPTNPSDVLGYVQGVSDNVTVVGPDTVDGAATTHYKVDIDLDQVAARQGPAAAPAMQQLKDELGASTLPAELWIDDQGRLRKLLVTVRTTGARPVTITTTQTLSDFGTPVQVVAPPPEQTTDLGALLAGSGAAAAR